MRRAGLLNARLSEVVARMGHGDLLVIADAGLPVPPGVELIDLSVVPGLPGVLDVARAVIAELAVEGTMIAAELVERGDAGLVTEADIRSLLPDVRPHVVTHEVLKRSSSAAVAIVRTGECSPYANVVLVAGVTF